MSNPHNATKSELTSLALDAVSHTKEAKPWLQELASINMIVRSAAATKVRQDAYASGRSAKAIWWSVFLVGTVASWAGSAAMLPPRRSHEVELEYLMAFAPPVAAIGALVVVILASLPVPSAVRRSPYASGLAASTVALAGAALAVNSFRAGELASASTDLLAFAWFASNAAILTASSVLVYRTKPRTKISHPEPSWRDGMREAKARAKALGKKTPKAGAAEIEEVWRGSLSNVAGSLTEEEVARLATLTPWQLLLESYLDSEDSLPHPLANFH